MAGDSGEGEEFGSRTGGGGSRAAGLACRGQVPSSGLVEPCLVQELVKPHHLQNRFGIRATAERTDLVRRNYLNCGELRQNFCPTCLSLSSFGEVEASTPALISSTSLSA